MCVTFVGEEGTGESAAGAREALEMAATTGKQRHKDGALT
jgi:hypothetical protein